MGWRDLFRKPEAPGPAAPPGTAAQSPPAARRFTLDRASMFDLAQTARLAAVIDEAPALADDAWRDRFLLAAWTASLELGSPPVFEGPDGFSYLRLHIPDPGAFQSQSLAELAPLAVERATGAAIFRSPGADKPAFVLPMGQLDSLLRFDSWKGDPVDLRELEASPQTADAEGMQRLTTGAGHQVLIGSPSRDYLPPATARALHHHLTAGWKMPDPRVSLLVDPSLAPSRNLMLSRSFDEFPDADRRTAQIRMLLWYLPPRRSILLRTPSTDPAAMTPLTVFFDPPAAT